jgi:cytochrome P450
MNSSGWNGLEAVLCAAVLVVCAIPVLRVAVKRPLRRELRAHPAIGAAAISLGIVVVTVCAWLARDSIVARRMLVTGAVLAAILAWRQARPSSGGRRGWPPGSLGLATSLDAIDDPDFYARAAERYGPVFKMRQVHRPVVCVTDLSIARDLLTRDDGSLGQSEWSFNRLIPDGYLEYMEGAAHDRYRAILGTALSPDPVHAAMRPIAEVSRAQLSAMARDTGRDGLHPEPFLYDVPFVALLHAVLGVSADDEHMPALRAGFAAITVPFEVHLPTPPGIAAGYDGLVREVRELARSAAASPVPSALRSLVRQDPALADDPTVIGNLVLMVKEGCIMVRGLLRWILRALASDASHVRALRAAGADELDGRCVSFVRETLRLHESRYLYRAARTDLVIGRFRVPRGWLVRLCIGEAHEHPDHFPEPQRFDPSRFHDTDPPVEQFCPFGAGAHSCLGADLTLAIAAGFVREAALGWDFRVVSDGPMWRINRHWGLWRPSTSFRIALSPRADAVHA